MTATRCPHARLISYLFVAHKSEKATRQLAARCLARHLDEAMDMISLSVDQPQDKAQAPSPHDKTKGEKPSRSFHLPGSKARETDWKLRTMPLKVCLPG